MAKQSGTARRRDDESVPTRTVDLVFRFVRFAEFEILFILFFVIAFIIFKDLELNMKGAKQECRPLMNNLETISSNDLETMGAWTRQIEQRKVAKVGD
ncbi:hypothetical protein HanHA300_Chr14g0507611 [Helianthus annuus]|uniref:uncharacterized protein LOC110905227 n=1 Tax=Helianthus annuus TaxID=4232 RepID=UPI000B8FD72A|nr:uncharacterized protein LOC110905227 [Helianthus annuus]XP_035838645.1 uncharacterized protein LOC110905227 [Helianthus annuus]KAJ0462754.1 hypothetical protein HanHA300_Chr14g0507611 [Helianthus annuus]KAJ0484085.1 hypothetical protein HanHA89_Chr14g0540231 [Helianthus annuus]